MSDAVCNVQRPPAMQFAKPSPCFWRDETTGMLRPAVAAYLSRGGVTVAQIALLRAYFHQWIFADEWNGNWAIDGLRNAVDSLTNRANLDLWVERAQAAGISPL